jgi:phage head maturation protease
MGRMGAALQVVRDALGISRPFRLELQPYDSRTLTLDSAPRPIDQLIAAMNNQSGNRVDRSSALSVAAVVRARNELCSTATLPLRLYKGLDVQDHPLFRQIDPETPNVVTLAQTIEDLIFDGIAWWQIIAQDFDGYPVAARFVSGNRVALDPPTSGRAQQTRPSGDPVPVAPDGRYVYLDGKQFPAALMIRFDSPNPGLLRTCGRAIRISLKFDSLSEGYADNPRPLEEFKPSSDPNSGDFTQDEVDAFLAEYATMRRLGAPAWIPGEVERSDVSQPSPAELQLAELKKAVLLDIANATGLDPEDLGVSTTSRTYFNAQDRRISKINEGRRPIMSAITDRLNMGDVTRRGYSVKFDLTEYLAADPATQATYWEALQRMGVTDAQEIRGWAGLGGPAPGVPATPATPAGAEQNRALVALELTGRTTLTLDVTAVGFSADTDTRTISGLAVPWNQVARKNGVAFRFLPGSLEWNAANLQEVKHLRDHVTPVGYARSIEATPDGLMVSLGVLDAEEGTPEKATRDQLLRDASDGLYDGLSVGVDFDLDNGDASLNESDNVWDISRATLREVTTTALPAYVNARVTRVAASRTEETQVDPCTLCGQRHAPGVACATVAQRFTQPAPTPSPTPIPAPTPGVPGTFQAPAGWSFGPTGWVPNGYQAPQIEQGVAEQRQFVSAQPAVAEVREALPYRFDRFGELRAGSHDFSSDLIAGWAPQGGSDVAARDRANGWVQTVFADEQENFQRQEFAITPANVAALNPNRNRPDMYVDQLEYQYPIYDAMNSGTLADLTPFVVPKFSSSSGLVADHVSGTEPTPGTFVATTQTITPSAVSGKVEILREAVDQGGNPQMSGLIWRQMVRGYYEALEAYSVAQLVAVAASITDITITTAAADSALDQALVAALVPLRYIRGGFRFRNVFTQVDLYTKLAAAKDSAGRPLYPSISPMNAAGEQAEDMGVIRARGLNFIPAWATAATSVNASSSYMIDPEKVHLWASAPRQINLEWRAAWVDMCLFGYKAFAVTDFAGTRELVYDPV